MWWKYIYDKWLEEGDLNVLTYLQKIEKYLTRGRQKSQQEILNLTSQIEALLEIPYSGDYTYYNMGNRSDTETLLNIMSHLHTVRLPKEDDIDALEYFFTNAECIRIKPQNTKLMCHPCWILWSRLYNKNISRALWAYRKQFIYYMEHNDFRGAARVYMHATKIRSRNSPLPLYSPHVLRKVMFCNIDMAARRTLAENRNILE